MLFQHQWLLNGFFLIIFGAYFLCIQIQSSIEAITYVECAMLKHRYCYNEKLNLPLSWKLMNTCTHSFTFDNENTIPDEIMYGLNWCKFLETENNVLSLAIDLVYWNNTQSEMWLFHRPPLYVDRSLYQATKNHQNFTFNFFLLRAVRFYNPRMNFSCVSEFHRFSAKTIVTTFWISSKALTFSEVKLPRGNTCRKGLKMSKC